MYQNYNSYYSHPNMRTIPQVNTNPQIIPQQTQPQGLKGRLVSSFEEARAASIDFDGSIFYFPDLASKRIYTKQINMDGTATLNMYELKEIPISNPNSSINFVTREEFEQALNKIQSSLNLISNAIPEEKTQDAPASYNF